MSKVDYVSLHGHSHYSYLDALSKPKDLAKRAKEVGMPAIAITDHGGVHSFIRMYKECRKVGIKFIPGIEFYMVHNNEDKERKSRHITVLAKNNEGLSTIYKLSTLSNYPVDKNGGFYYRPRIDWKMLEKYNKGLIILSGCMNSPINHEFGQNEDYETGKEHAEHFIKIVGKDRFFVELQNVNEKNKIYIPEQQKILEFSRKLAKDFGLKSCCSNDLHYINKNDAFAHEVLKAIDARATLETPKADPKRGIRGRLIFNGFDYYVKSADEMSKKFSPAEIQTTKEIADACSVDFNLKEKHIPKFDENMSDEEVFNFIKEKARLGWKQLKINDSLNKEKYKNRVKLELRDIKDAGLQNYFAIVWDVVNFCLKNNIPVSKGRGSAAGSLVCYLLRITDVDPIENGLIWERFWNRGRKASMPDIDLDICIESRDKVIKYLRDKFGHNRVFPMMTLSTLTTKAALADVGKVLGLSFSYVNKLTNHVPVQYGKCASVSEAIKRSKVLRDASKGIDDEARAWQKEMTKLAGTDRRDSNTLNRIKVLREKILKRQDALKKTFEVAEKLENVARQRSAHACALLIADKPVFGNIPLCYDAKHKKLLTAFDMYDLEELGYLKLDILGLKTLSVCSRIYPQGVRQIREFNDPKVFELISSGKTKGIFQLESPLGQQWCKKLRPKNIQELSDLLALIRPAVLEVGMADEYLKNRNNPDNIKYIHEELRSILESTYGTLVYQEQMLEICRKFAGFDLSKSDLLRKAIGKKREKDLKNLKNDFIDGVKKKYDESLANELWRWMENGASYGFCKSHSLSYAQMAYITAWMKLYHTKKFFLAMLQLSDNEQKPQKEVKELFFDARFFDVPIAPPSMRKCNTNFELDDDTIYFGLKHIKRVGPSAISSAKRLKDYKSWTDVLENISEIKLKKDVMLAFIYSGALDYIGKSRRSMAIEYLFLQSLQRKELEVFRHIHFGKPDKLQKKTKKKTLDIKLVKCQSFEEAVKNLKSFAEGVNKEYKLVNSRRTPKLINLCEKFLDTYNNGTEFTNAQKAVYEEEHLGIPATCSIVDGYYNARQTHTLIECERELDDIGICTIAKVSKINIKLDKKNRTMAFVGLEDNTFCLDSILFANKFSFYKNILKTNKVYLFEGVKRRGSLIINRIEPL